MRLHAEHIVRGKSQLPPHGHTVEFANHVSVGEIDPDTVRACAKIPGFSALDMPKDFSLEAPIEKDEFGNIVALADKTAVKRGPMVLILQHDTIKDGRTHLPPFNDLVTFHDFKSHAVDRETADAVKDIPGFHVLWEAEDPTGAAGGPTAPPPSHEPASSISLAGQPTSSPTSSASASDSPGGTPAVARSADADELLQCENATPTGLQALPIPTKTTPTAAQALEQLKRGTNGPNSRK